MTFFGETINTLTVLATALGAVWAHGALSISWRDMATAIVRKWAGCKGKQLPNTKNNEIDS